MGKLLICGDVRGRLGTLAARVAKLHASAHGPFDAVLAVGEFFAEGTDADAHGADTHDADSAAILAGDKPFPVPLYFVAGKRGPSGTAATGGEVCPNVTFLGRAGVRDICGLRVAFLSGLHDPTAFREPPPSPIVVGGDAGAGAGAGAGARVAGVGDGGGGGDGGESGAADGAGSQAAAPAPAPAPAAAYDGAYREADVFAIASACKAGAVDVLLTAEWGAGVLNAAGAVPEQLGGADAARAVGSSVVADLACAARPRYHFAGSESVRTRTDGAGAFFARAPYRNDVDATHVTRFVALCPVVAGAPKALKWMHALNLAPMATMSPAELGAHPPGTTPCPYTAPAPPRPVKRPRDIDGGSAGAGAGVSATGGIGLGGASSGVGGTLLRPGDILGPPPAPAMRTAPGFSREMAMQLQRDEAAAAMGMASGAFFYGARGGGPGGRGGRGRRGPGGMPGGPGGRGRSLLGRGGHASTGAGAGAGAGGGGGRGGPPPESRECWFCLASPSVEKHLIASISGEAYLALPKGGISGDHVLVIPVEHYPSMAAAPVRVRYEVSKYLGALATCFAKTKGQALVAWERVIQTRGAAHTHLQVVPVPPSVAKGIRDGFEEHGKRLGIGFESLGPNTELHSVAGGGQYLYVEARDATAGGDAGKPTERLFHAVPPPPAKHPLQFGRQVVCRLLGKPERSHWKDCRHSVDEETAMTKDFRAAFAPFDFSLEDDE